MKQIARRSPVRPTREVLPGQAEPRPDLYEGTGVHPMVMPKRSMYGESRASAIDVSVTRETPAPGALQTAIPTRRQQRGARGSVPPTALDHVRSRGSPKPKTAGPRRRASGDLAPQHTASVTPPTRAKTKKRGGRP